MVSRYLPSWITGYVTKPSRHHLNQAMEVITSFASGYVVLRTHRLCGILDKKCII